MIRIDSDWKPIKYHCFDRRKIRGQTVVAGVPPHVDTQRVFRLEKQARQSSRNVSTGGGEETREDHERNLTFSGRFVIGQQTDYRGNKGTPFFERDDDLSLPVCERKKATRRCKQIIAEQTERLKMKRA